jgi:hypothetical protein
MTQSFLLIGISWDHFARLAETPEKAKEMESSIRSLLDKGEKQFTDAGFGYRFVDYSPEESMGRLQGILMEKDWAGVAM